MFAFKTLRPVTLSNSAPLPTQTYQNLAGNGLPRKRPHVRPYNLYRRTAPHRKLRRSKDALQLFSATAMISFRSFRICHLWSFLRLAICHDFPMQRNPGFVKCQCGAIPYQLFISDEFGEPRTCSILRKMIRETTNFK